MLSSTPHPTTTANAYLFEIHAGLSLGPFRLGMEIGAALKTAAHYCEDLAVIVDHDQPFEHDTVIGLPTLGIRLAFSGYAQRLQLTFHNTEIVKTHKLLRPSPQGYGECLTAEQRPTFVTLKNPIHIDFISLHHSIPDVVLIAPLDRKETPTNLAPSLHFSLNGQLLVEAWRTPPNLRRVYHVCGPAVPGHMEDVRCAYTQTPEDTEEDNTETDDREEYSDSSYDATPCSVTQRNGPNLEADAPAKFSSYYYLKYPGVAFRFPIKTEDVKAIKALETDEDVLPYLLGHRNTAISQSSAECKDNGLPLQQILLYGARCPLEDDKLPPWCHHLRKEPESLDTSRKKHDRFGLHPPTYQPLATLHPSRYLKVWLHQGIQFPSGVRIPFGAGLQDVYQELGPAEQVTLKDWDIVRIMETHPVFQDVFGKDLTQRKGRLHCTDSVHQDDSLTDFDGVTRLSSDTVPHIPQDAQKTTSSPSVADYFCNYFSYGLDIMFCGVTHRVKKFVLHNNLPGHYRFGDYARCFFVIYPEASSGASTPTTQADKWCSLDTPQPQFMPEDSVAEEPQDTSKTSSTHPKKIISINSPWPEIQNILGSPSVPLLVEAKTPSHRALTSSLPLFPGDLKTLANKLPLFPPQTVRKFYGYPGNALSVAQFKTDSCTHRPLSDL